MFSWLLKPFYFIASPFTEKGEVAIDAKPSANTDNCAECETPPQRPAPDRFVNANVNTNVNPDARDDEMSLEAYVARHTICYARIYDEDCNSGDIVITYFCDDTHKDVAISAYQKESGENEGLTDEESIALQDKHYDQGIDYRFVVFDKDQQDNYVDHRKFFYDHETEMQNIYRMDPSKFGDKIRYDRPTVMPDIDDVYKHKLTHYFNSGCSSDSRTMQFFTKDGCSKEYRID